VAVSPDGRRAVSASRDRMRKNWDLELPVIVATFTCDASALCCVFAGAGGFVARGLWRPSTLPGIEREELNATIEEASRFVRQQKFR
jgi:hypothetical protein